MCWPAAVETACRGDGPGGAPLPGPPVPGPVLRSWAGMTPMNPSSGNGGPAVAVSVSVTMTQVNEDGSESPLDGELAAALAGPAGQVSGRIAGAAPGAGGGGDGEGGEGGGGCGPERRRRRLE